MTSKSGLPNTNTGPGGNDLYNVSAFDFVTSLNLDEIDTLRKPLEQNIARLLLAKARIRPNEFEQLNNYHQYALNILNNMENIKRVENNNPYNRNMMSVVKGQYEDVINPYGVADTAITDRNGNVKIVPASPFQRQYQQEWMNQFDAQLINPPAYVIPPQNQWALPMTQPDPQQPMMKQSFTSRR